MKYYLDTNICIYFLKGLYPELLDKIMLYNPDDIKIASIVKAELLYGAEKSKKRDDNLEKVNKFLLPFEIVPFDNNAAEKYSAIRTELEKAGNIIGPNDLIISATVLSQGGILVTNNGKEFKRVPGLAVEEWVGSAI